MSSSLPPSLYSNRLSTLPNQPGGASSKPLTGSHPHVSSASVIEMFNKHEANLRQIMKQREEKFKELEKTLLFTGQEIDKYKAMNESLYQKISKLESSLENEHNKLKQRIVDEERRAASSSLSLSSMSPTLH